MPAAFVQSVTGTALTANPSSGTWGSALTVGNVVIATIVNDSGSSNYVTSVTSSNVTTWTRAFAGLVDSQGSESEVWWGTVTSSSTAAFTMGYTLTASTRIVWVAQEFSGLDTTAPFDKVSAIASGSSTAPLSNTTGTLTQADSLVCGHVAWVTGTSTLTAGAGYTNSATNGAATSSARFGGAESKIVAATTAQTANFTLGTSRPWGCFATAWKASAGSGARSPQPTQGYPSNPVLQSFSW